MVAHTFNLSKGDKGEQVSQFLASLIYRVNYTEKPYLEKQKTNKKKLTDGCHLILYQGLLFLLRVANRSGIPCFLFDI